MRIWIGSMIVATAACGDKVVVPEGPHHRYVVDSIQLPTSAAEALQYGLDLSNDGKVDNALGMAFGVLVAHHFELTSVNREAIDRGTMIMLVDLQASDLADTDAAALTMYAGANPSPAPCDSASDTVCRHHLGGTATFDLAATSPIDPPLAGEVNAGTFTSDAPGSLTIQLVLGTTIIQLPLATAKVSVTGLSEAGISGVLAGGITKNTIHNVVIPAFYATFAPLVQRDCPGTDPKSMPPCLCVESTTSDPNDLRTGKIIHDLFDTAPADCKLTLDELENNNITKTLLAPDLSLATTPLVSAGVHFTAVSAAFRP